VGGKARPVVDGGHVDGHCGVDPQVVEDRRHRGLGSGGEVVEQPHPYPLGAEGVAKCLEALGVEPVVHRSFAGNEGILGGAGLVPLAHPVEVGRPRPAHRIAQEDEQARIGHEALDPLDGHRAAKARGREVDGDPVAGCREQRLVVVGCTDVEAQPGVVAAGHVGARIGEEVDLLALAQVEPGVLTQVVVQRRGARPRHPDEHELGQGHRR